MPSVVPMHVARSVAAVVGAAMLLAGSSARAQDLNGRWVYEESGQTAELEVRHDRATNKATGSLSLFGAAAAFEGVVVSGALVIQRLGDVRASAENGSMTGKLQGTLLVLTISQPGQSTVTLPMVRRGDPARARPSATPDLGVTPVPTVGFRAGTAQDFSGEWHFASADSTDQEVLELAMRGTEVTGQLAAYERGAISGRTREKARFIVRGSLANGALQLRFWNVDASPNDATAATGRLRGEYFIFRAGDSETGYARSGRSLVQSGAGSAEAAAYARALTGRVYSRSNQARGRGGAMVGGRLRYALCSNGAMELDASDVAVTPDGGGGGGSTTTRRGAWSVVLYAGAPVVRAQWRGTGTSYSLIAYFHVQPEAGGRSIKVGDESLPMTGQC
jgi:hypothetical protein